MMESLQDSGEGRGASVCARGGRAPPKSQATPNLAGLTRLYMDLA